MSDSISRQAAIDFIDAGRLGNPNEPRWSDNEIVGFLKSRPSAEPERKKGKWTDGRDMLGYPRIPYHCNIKYCSECGSEAYWDTDYGQQLFDFCPFCGADTRG